MNNLVEVTNGRGLTSSRQVAEYFQKEHFNVLTAIEDLLIDLEPASIVNDITSNLVTHLEEFQKVLYKDKKGEMRREYLMTRGGFILLGMGLKVEKHYSLN